MNDALFVSFSSSHDLDRVPVGEQFTCSWRIRNTGTTPWGAGYRVAHIHASTGSQMLAVQDSFPFAEVASLPTAAPGEEVEINIPMTAPALSGRRYFTDWQLQDPSGILFGEIIWLRLVTVPQPVAPSSFRSSNCQFLEDISVEDGTPMDGGTPFLKQWLVKNTGQRKWGAGYRLVFVSGDREMCASVSHLVPEAEPGEEVVISVEMTAPTPRHQPYTSGWRLHDDRNIPFGDKLWVKIFSIHKLDGSDITPYSQNDPAWKHQVVGNGTRTMAEFGCLITCYAMMLSTFNEHQTPWELNNRFLTLPPGHGYNGSDVFFIAPASAYSHVTFVGNFKPFQDTGATFAVHDPNLIGRIDQALAAGQAVIAQVDTDPSDPYTLASEQHWVLLLARLQDDYLIVDPFTGESLSLLSKYGQQSRPEAVESALKNAIKSAIIYASSRVAPVPVVAPDPTGTTRLGTDGALSYTGPAWPFGHCLIGLHDRADRHPQPQDHAVARGRFESIKVQSGVTVAEMEGYDADFYLCRLFETWNGRHLPVSDFVRAVVPDITPLVNAGVQYFELHNEPNLTHEGLKASGIEGSWRNGAEFAQYFIECRQQLKARFPGIKVGFPGLSPGPDVAYQFGHDSGFRMNDVAFLEGAAAGIQAADFLCVHAYYVNMAEVQGSAIELVKRYRRSWPEKLLFITEFSNPNENAPVAEKGPQAKEFYQLCAQIPGIGAAYYFIVSGTGWDSQSLRRNNDGLSTGLVDLMLP